MMKIVRKVKTSIEQLKCERRISSLFPIGRVFERNFRPSFVFDFRVCAHQLTPPKRN